MIKSVNIWVIGINSWTKKISFYELSDLFKDCWQIRKQSETPSWLRRQASRTILKHRIPAFAGMTSKDNLRLFRQSPLLANLNLYSPKSKNEGFKQNRQIKEKRHVIFIVQVVLHILVNGFFAVTTQLPQSGDARQHLQPFPMGIAISRSNERHFRSRPDQWHFSF